MSFCNGRRKPSFVEIVARRLFDHLVTLPAEHCAHWMVSCWGLLEAWDESIEFLADAVLVKGFAMFCFLMALDPLKSYYILVK